MTQIVEPYIAGKEDEYIEQAIECLQKAQTGFSQTALVHDALKATAPNSAAREGHIQYRDSALKHLAQLEKIIEELYWDFLGISYDFDDYRNPEEEDDEEDSNP